MSEEIYPTNYSVAVNWLNNNYILCNEIHKIDETIYESLLENIDLEEDEDFPEIYQWYISDCDKYDVDFLKEHFGILFAYSELLDLYILCVDHYGTSWDYVYNSTDLEQAQRKLGESKYDKK